MIYIIIGHYGSGKTEVAINLAQTLENATIIDMDIVNPYFRTKDAENMLTDKGVNVIAPEFANTNVDVPSLPPHILGALQTGENVVLDVGGDDDGAIALGQYSRYITEKGYEMICVANVKRPLTDTAEGIVEAVRAIETVSRLKVTSIINNTNIRFETTPDMVSESQNIVDEAAAVLNIPVKAVSGTAEVLKDVQTNVPKMELKLNLKLPWEV